MARRFYLIPQVGTGTRADPYRPKHIDAAADWSALQYGDQGWFVVAMQYDSAIHLAIDADSECRVFPEDLSASPGTAAKNQAEAWLESINCPGDWVHLARINTWRKLLKGVATIFMVAQRFHGMGYSKIVPDGANLATTFAELSGAQRAKYQAVADDLGIDVSDVVATDPLRKFLKRVALKFDNTAVYMGSSDEVL